MGIYLEICDIEETRHQYWIGESSKWKLNWKFGRENLGKPKVKSNGYLIGNLVTFSTIGYWIGNQMDIKLEICA